MMGIMGNYGNSFPYFFETNTHESTLISIIMFFNSPIS